ncbi:MAG: phage terminase large subunit family protein [Gammaproteobacteria bacterium]|nr:phage terminase large subunit family protein [Gammaproteobacteria bacterium]
MDAVRDPAISEIVVMKSAQIGWTEILVNVIGYHIHLDPCPIMVMQPTLEMARAWSKDRLAPMLRDTPVLRLVVGAPRARSGSNTIMHKHFAGGHLTIVGANSPASLASRPIRLLLCDEVDRFPVSAGAEGDPYDLARKRTATFLNRKILIGSSPTIRGASRIEIAFELSDQRYYYVPCPECGHMQRLVWAQVRWPDGRPEDAAYSCAACGVLIPEAAKHGMLLRGEWRATRNPNGIAGFHVSELYSPWSTWPEMAEEFLRAKKFPETFKTWVNLSLGETWEEDARALAAEGLMQRVEAYNAQSLPDGVQLVTAGVDVQDDRLEITVWGWGIDEEAWRVEHIVLRGDPASPQLWSECDHALQRSYRTENGRELKIEAACVDSGGHYTEQVYRFCGPLKRRRVWAVKGIGGAGRAAWPNKPSRVGKLRAELYLIGVETIIDTIYGRLRRVTHSGPGCLHFDATTTEDWLAQLTSMKVLWRTVHGRKVRQWVPKYERIAQEGLDTTVYAYAAFLGRGGERVVRSRVGHVRAADTVQHRVDVEQDSVPESAEEKRVAQSVQEGARILQRPSRPQPVRRRDNWVNRWRW